MNELPSGGGGNGPFPTSESPGQKSGYCESVRDWALNVPQLATVFFSSADVHYQTTPEGIQQIICRDNPNLPERVILAFKKDGRSTEISSDLSKMELARLISRLVISQKSVGLPTAIFLKRAIGNKLKLPNPSLQTDQNF